MTASVHRHNLARLREHLNITQETLATFIGRSTISIRQIETGRLTLSKRLAAQIELDLGCDKDWLLRNDLSEPMPPLKPSPRKSDPERTETDVEAAQYSLIEEVLDWLFALVARRDKDNQYRHIIELKLTLALEWLGRTPKAIPGCLPDSRYYYNRKVLSERPELCEPELLQLINLDGVIALAKKQPREKLTIRALGTSKASRHPKVPGRKNEHQPK